MSNDNSTLIFVYGTLKTNEPNYGLIKERNVKFISSGVTLDKWPLIIATERNVPFLLNKPNYGKNVKGELYEADQATIDFLDEFEGVKLNVYSPIEIEVTNASSGLVQKARTYILDNYKLSLLNENTILFENYSSVNDYFGPYINKKDFPNFNFDDYIKQIKEKI